MKAGVPLFGMAVWVASAFISAADVTGAAPTQEVIKVERTARQTSIALTPEEQAWLAQNHVVDVRVTSYTPYYYAEEGEAKGICVDYIKLIAERTGLRLHLRFETRHPYWHAVESMGRSEGPDLMIGMTQFRGREDDILYSDRYMAVPIVIYTQTGSEYISGVEDLRGKTLAMPPNIPGSDTATYQGITLKKYPGAQEALLALSAGEVDAYVGDLLLSTYTLAKEGYSNLKVAAPGPTGDRWLHFGNRPDWPELTSIINKGLATITPLERSRIQGKYLSLRYEYGVRPGEVFRWVGIVAGAALLIVLLFVTWNRQLRWQVRQRTAELSAHQERLRALAAELTVTEERERRRIAAELHDGPAQSLAFARMQLALALKAVTDKKAAAKLDDLSQLLKESLQQVRDGILDLNSPALNEIGLAAAISEWLEEHLGRRHGLQTSFTDEVGNVPLTDDMLAVLYRNTRELLANVIKHADAGKVSVRLASTGDTIRITVEDDGKGFASGAGSDTLDREGSYGLFSIRERMADMGGALEIVSACGEGCKATLIAPLEGREERHST